MNIVHAPTEIAGQMGTLCKALRKRGHKAAGYNCFHTYLSYKGDIINTDTFELMKDFDFLLEHAEIFHFHNANTLLPNFEDLPILKAQGKKMIMHHWGNDVRTVEMVKKLNPYELEPTYYSDEEIHKQLTTLSQYIDTAIVQDYEVYPYVKDYYKNVYVLPLACNTKDFQVAYPSITNTTPLILHAPTNRAFKGSDHVDAAITQIRDQAAFNYKVLEKMSHEEALAQYLEADIIVDQLLCGTYGMLSVEAMAMGKPVVAFIRDDVRQNFPSDLPIVHATPESLPHVLLDLIHDPKRRHDLGIAGRHYVEKYHSSDIVANKLISIYNNL